MTPEQHNAWPLPPMDDHLQVGVRYVCPNGRRSPLTLKFIDDDGTLVAMYDDHSYGKVRKMNFRGLVPDTCSDVPRR